MVRLKDKFIALRAEQSERFNSTMVRLKAPEIGQGGPAAVYLCFNSTMVRLKGVRKRVTYA